jgi:polynucleotide 5'-hydroxyl-kinase GRC3/NOL9
MGCVPEPGWEGLVPLLRGRTALFIGRTDAGKTTLVRHVMAGLLSAGERVCVVDSDVGQSALGMPGTVCMRIFRGPGEAGNYTPEKMLFVGTVNPAGNITAVVGAAGKMVREAREAGAGTILVDTTGLVQGGPGLALKLAKIRELRPDSVVAVERADELEHIIEKIKGPAVRRIRASPLAREKSRGARAGYRERRYRVYFRGARVLKVPAGAVEFVSDGRAFDPRVSPLAAGTVVGFERGGWTAALGVVEGMEAGMVLIKTPLETEAGVGRIISSRIII